MGANRGSRGWRPVRSCSATVWARPEEGRTAGHASSEATTTERHGECSPARSRAPYPPAGTSAAVRWQSSRTAASSRSSSPSTRRRAGPPYNPVTRASSQSGTSSRDRTTAARPGPSPGTSPTAGTSSTPARACSPLPDGGLLCTFETFKTYDDPGVWRYTGGAVRSDDGGRTWRPPVISAASDPDGDQHDTMWWDPRIARLASGELVQCYYAFRHATRTEGPVHIAWSPDDGGTWTAPTSTGLPGQATYPLPLPDGRLVVFQQRRAETQSMSQPSQTTAAERSTAQPSSSSTNTSSNWRPAPTAR